MRLIGVVLLLLPLSLLQAQDSKSYLSLTFDDATVSQYQNGFPLLQQRGVTATLYVNTHDIDQRDGFYMSWSQIRELHRASWEIGSHSVMHTDISSLDEREMFYEVAYSKYRLENELGNRVLSFAPPYGLYNDLSSRYVVSLYQNQVLTGGGFEGVKLQNVQLFSIKRISVDDKNYQKACEYIREYSGTGEWIVFMFHQVVDNPVDYSITPEHLEVLLNCVVYERESGKLLINTVSGVLSWILG